MTNLNQKRIGGIIQDGNGNEWVVAKKFDWDDYSDLELFRRTDGKRGEARIYNE